MPESRSTRPGPESGTMRIETVGQRRSVTAPPRWWWRFARWSRNVGSLGSQLLRDSPCAKPGPRTPRTTAVAKVRNARRKTGRDRPSARAHDSSMAISCCVKKRSAKIRPIRSFFLRRKRAEEASSIDSVSRCWIKRFRGGTLPQPPRSPKKSLRAPHSVRKPRPNPDRRGPYVLAEDQCRFLMKRSARSSCRCAVKQRARSCRRCSRARSTEQPRPEILSACPTN